MRVPFTDLSAQYRRLQPLIDEAVARVLQSGWYIGGSEVEAFEQAFAKACGVPYAVGVANGTDAITLALRALGVGPGDEVVLPALSAYPTTVGVVQAGAVPVFADVRLEDGLIDPGCVDQAVTERTRAVVPVHLYGTPCDIGSLRRMMDACQIALAEDCAQAHGARWNGYPVGLFSAAAAWSFYPTKNLGAFGDAGAVTTADARLAERLRRLRNYGQHDRYAHVERGVNSRLDPLQAAILSVKLGCLEGDNAHRRALCARYEAGLAGIDGIELLSCPPAAVPSRHLFPIRLLDPGRREMFQARLLAYGVETLIHYPIAMPDQEATDPAWRRHDRYPNARRLCESVVSLPIYPELSETQVDYVLKKIKTVLAE